ncbi:MAG: hypothetical protein Kow0068_10720 [Marinilabiliales bacterium]
MQLEILFSDDLLSVVNKPADLPVHKNKFMPKDSDFLNKIAGKQLNKNIYNVHRLDSKTSGLIILAHTKEVSAYFENQFQQKKINKEYLAVVFGKPLKSGTFDNDLYDKSKKKLQKALTHYTTLNSLKFNDIDISLCKIIPETGRWHQIRKHFAMNGYPIIGDQKHGNRDLNKKIQNFNLSVRLMLHAVSISFVHPETKEKQIFETKIPDDFIKFH